MISVPFLCYYDMRCTLGGLRLPGRPCPQLGLEYTRRAGPMASNNGIFFSQKEAAVSPEREPKVLMGGSGTGGRRGAQGGTSDTDCVQQLQNIRKK